MIQLINPGCRLLAAHVVKYRWPPPLDETGVDIDNPVLRYALALVDATLRVRSARALLGDRSSRTSRSPAVFFPQSRLASFNDGGDECVGLGHDVLCGEDVPGARRTSPMVAARAIVDSTPNTSHPFGRAGRQTHMAVELLRSGCQDGFDEADRGGGVERSLSPGLKRPCR